MANVREDRVLAARMKLYNVPKRTIVPFRDRVLLWPILPSEKIEGSSMGLVKPMVAIDDEQPRFLLCDWGLQAADVMRSHGIFLGDIVWTGRYIGTDGVRADTALKAGEGQLNFSVGNYQFINGSEDQVKRMEAGLVERAIGKDGRHMYVNKGGKVVHPRPAMED